MDVETEAVVNPGQQRPDPERRVFRPQRRHKGHHRVVELVCAMGPAFSRHEASDAPLFERGLRLIERRARNPKRLGLYAPPGRPRRRPGGAFRTLTCTRSRGSKKSWEANSGAWTAWGRGWSAPWARKASALASRRDDREAMVYNYAVPRRAVKRDTGVSHAKPICHRLSPCFRRHIDLGPGPRQRRISPNTCGVISLTLPIGACARGQNAQTHQQIG